MDLASASTAWTNDPEASPAATRPSTALLLVSVSADALMLSPVRFRLTRLLGRARWLEPLI